MEASLTEIREKQNKKKKKRRQTHWRTIAQAGEESYQRGVEYVAVVVQAVNIHEYIRAGHSIRDHD
jgi:acetyl-CoA carboxylase beta subunit